SIHRAFVAARIPIAYSQGFNPHPRMAFGPPLPLGACGMREYFDVAATGNIGEEWTDVNRWLPRDLEVIECISCNHKPSSITSSLKAGEYLVRFTDEIGEKDIERAVDEFKKQSRIVVTLEKKGRTVEKDIAPMVTGLEKVMLSGCPGLRARLSLAPDRTCRPADLLAKLFPGRSPSSFAVTRMECLL
ncbi:MAG: DUF2344 domain-containing protein, partial [Chitinivibrionales bacterium]|nr:DUF2344 domain-containing protein [Chitinivibrionales bacterium]